MSHKPEFLRHLKFQSGCYLDRTEFDASIAYARSSRITDVGWNYIYAPDPATALAASKSDARGIQTLFYGTLSERAFLTDEFPGSSVHEETWLERMTPIASLSPEHSPFSGLVLHADPAPTSDFLDVFEGVLSDLGVSADDVSSFQKQYGSALRSARPVEGVGVRHFIGYVKDTPVACASIYFDDAFACLYNVGAAKDSKKRGYGSHISALAVNSAFTFGVGQVFLQCATGGYVEKMYRKIGFTQITDGTGFIDFALPAQGINPS